MWTTRTLKLTGSHANLQVRHACLGALLGWTISCAVVLAPSAHPADLPVGEDPQEEPAPLSPAAVVLARDGSHAFVACATAGRVQVIGLPSGEIERAAAVAGMPADLVLAPDGSRLFVACSGTPSQVQVLDPATLEPQAVLPAGHTASALALSPDGAELFVCNRFNDDVWALSARDGAFLGRFPVLREPVAAAVSPDGTLLVVANHLPDHRADDAETGAAVTVIDLRTREVLKHVPLPRGCGMLRGLAFSPDGRYVVVTHLLARYYLPTTHVDFGRINSNGISIIDLRRLAWRNLLLLDTSGRGAGNPWDVAWTADGGTIVVSHAGTHEISLVDAAALLDRRTVAPRRVSLEGRGPRGLALHGSQVVVTGYFSDTVEWFGMDDPELIVTKMMLRELPPADAAGAESFGLLAAGLPAGQDPASQGGGRSPWPAGDGGQRSARPTGLPLTGSGDVREASEIERERADGRDQRLRRRRGEALFNDATLCFQGWQSCASCHDSDARVDALNWDLLNDGTGNPKNAKSLLWAHRTPPAMSLGVRANAAVAVRAGLRHILFTEQPESVALALEAYLESLEPIPSPWLEQGRLSAAAERGRQLFMDREVGCSRCHPPPLFTDLRTHDVGTQGRTDRPNERFDTPTLVEIWRTAPYLHDGSAASLRDVLTTANPRDQLGRTSHLNAAQRDDLVAYLRSL